MPTDQKPPFLVIGLVPPELRRALAEHYVLVDHIIEGPDALPAGEAPRDTRVVVTRPVLGAPPEIMDLPDLELIISFGVGTDKLDLEKAKSRGIEIAITPDELTEDVADFAIGLFYAAQRRIAEGDRFVRAGKWIGGRRFGTSRRVSARSVGIIGMGKIGGRIAEKARALGMTVRYHGRAGKPGVPGFVDSPVELARQSDVLILACAATPETHHIVDAAVIAALGAEGIIVNIARGSVIDENAMIAALESGAIAGAALDVFDNEPDIDARFLKLDNVVLSAHAASATEETRAAMVERLVQAALDHFPKR